MALYSTRTGERIPLENRFIEEHAKYAGKKSLNTAPSSPSGGTAEPRTPAASPAERTARTLEANARRGVSASNTGGTPTTAQLRNQARQAAADLDTDTLNRVNAQLKERRAAAGKQTAGDRANDIATAIFAGSGAGVTNTVGTMANAFNDPESKRRQITRLQKRLADGGYSDGKRFVRDTEDERKTIRDSIRRLADEAWKLEQEDSFTNKTQKLADRMQDAGAAAQERAKESLGAVGSTLVDAGISTGQSMLDAGIGALTGTGMAPFVVRAFGGAAQEARRGGADLDQQLGYGTTQAAKEYITEKLFGLAVPQRISGSRSFGSVDDAIEKGIRSVTERLAKTSAGQQAIGGLLTWLAGGATEGLEEGIGSVIENTLINPNLREWDPDTRTGQEKFEDALYDMLVGGVSGLMGVTNLFTYDASAGEGAVQAPPALTAQAETSAASMEGEEILRQAALEMARGEQADAQQTAAPESGAAVVADTRLFDRNILDNFNSARKNLIEFARKHFPTQVVNAETGKAIGISRIGLDKFLSGNIPYEKYASGFHIPELIERAHKVGDANNYHQTEKEAIPTFEYYDSPIEIDGQMFNAHIRVKNTQIGDKYYGHTISEVEDIKIEPPTRTSVPGNPAVQPENTGGSIEPQARNSSPESPVVRPVNAIGGSVEGTRPLNSDFTIAQGADSVKFTGTAQERTPEEMAYDIQRLRQASSAFGESGAKAMMAAYDGQSDAGTFYGGFSAYYQAGLSGADTARTDRRYGGALTDAQKYAAYTAGQNDAKASLARERQAAKYAQTAGTDSGLVYDDFVREAVESGRTRDDVNNETRAYLDAGTAEKINQVAQDLGVRVRFVDAVRGGTANAQITGSEILVERNNENPVVAVIGHEMTHRMQELAPEQYRQFRDLVTREGPADLPTVEDLMALYAKHGVELSIENAMDEVAADYAGRLMNDGQVLDDFIRRSRENRTLLEKIRDVIHTIARKLTGKEKKRALNAEQKLTEALDRTMDAARKAAARQGQKNNAARESGGDRYSISYDKSNTPYVVIEEDILDGVPREKWIETVKGTLKQKFPMGVRLGNNTIKINDKTRREMTFSEYTKWLARNDRETYADKFRSANYADEIILASRDYINEGLRHERKDNIRDFARGTVQLRVGENDYTAEVIVGTTSGGNMLLYDIVNLQPTKIQERSRRTVRPNQTESHRSGTPASTDSITQTVEKSKSENGRYSLKGEYELMEKTRQLERQARREGWSDEKLRQERRQAVDQVYDALLKEYGALSPGEKPARSIQVPKKTSANEKVSQTVRTILEARATPEEAIPTIQEMAAKGEFSFESISDKDAIARAERTITDRNWGAALRDWQRDMAAGNVSKDNTALGWALYNNAANTGHLDDAMDVLRYMVQHQRSAAQALQATRILKSLSPEGQLYGAVKSVEGLQKELNDRYGDKRAPELKIDEELGKKLLEAGDQEARDAVLRDIYRDIGRQMPSRFLDKWNAWRYLAMLGNPRTHVRNVVGNAGFAPVVAVKDLTATAIEAAVNAVSGGRMERSKGFVGLGKTGRALLSAAWADYGNVAEAALGGGKYSDLQNANKYIEEGRVIFKGKTVGRALETARKANSAALDKEDVWFSQPHYAYAMAQFCAAHKITEAEIRKGNPKVLEAARNYAVREAQKATYRDTNALSQTISRLGRDMTNSKNPVSRGISFLAEGILPFRKTPANILARGLEYSPLGLLKSISYDLTQVKRGNMSGAEAIDHISTGLTGTGLLALGVFLAAQGLVRGLGAGDDKEKELEDLQGHQDYSLELPNGTSVTLDWLAPEALPFFVGVNLWETFQRDRDVTMSTMLDAVGNVSEPMLEMSCLQSLNDALDVGTRVHSGGLGVLPSVLAGAAASHLTQGLPTIFGQLERTVERERNTTYTEKNAFFNQELQYSLGKASGKIPVWEYQQIPYIDAWGRHESSGGVGKRAFNNFANPAYTSKIQEEPPEEELLRLYRQTGDAGVLPGRAETYFSANGERRDLSAQEYVRYAEDKGRTSLKLAAEVTQNGVYSPLDDGEKAACIKDAYTYAAQTARAKIDSGAHVDQWVVYAQEAEKLHYVPADIYILARNTTKDIESLKDADGNSIANSKGLQIMQKVYALKGLNDRQRKAMFGYLGVGKKIIGYNRAAVDEALGRMRKQAAK